MNILKKCILFFIFLKYFKNVNCYECSGCKYVSGIICTHDEEPIYNYFNNIIGYNYDYQNFCNTYCKPRYSRTGVACYRCTATSSYYTITESNACLIDTCIGNKIIAHTLECTDREVNL